MALGMPERHCIWGIDMNGILAFSRKCSVLNDTKVSVPMIIKFYLPEPSDKYGGYQGFVDIDCEFFSTTLQSTGGDAAQAFFWLPKVVVAYLIGQRRFGYEAYWLEQGDLDSPDFWT